MDSRPATGSPRAAAQRLKVSRLIAGLQIWGGIYGLYYVVVALDRGIARTPGGMVTTILACLYFGASIKAGVDLSLKKRSAIALSLGVQIPQLVQFQIDSVVWSVWSGARIAIGLSDWTLRLHGDIGSYFRVGVFAPSLAGFVDVNLLAVVAVALLVLAPLTSTAARDATNVIEPSPSKQER